MTSKISNAAIPIATALLIASASTFGLAQDAGVPADPAGPQEGGGDVSSRLSGNWELAVPRATAQQTVDRAIERVTASLPLVGRVLAGELHDRNHVNGRFRLEIGPDAIHSRFENAEFRSAPGARVQAPVPGSSSEQMEYVQIVREGHLEQIFTTGRGRRWSIFTPSADGSTLTLDVTVTSSLLPDVMRYRLQYRRGG